jgi:hypothetical protein
MVGGSLHNVLNTPPCRGAVSPVSSVTSSPVCNSGAILDFVARDGGGVEVDSGLSASDPESPLQATVMMKARQATMPMNMFRLKSNRLFKCFFVIIFC